MKKEKNVEKVLVLRTCKPDMISYNDFEWPMFGEVNMPAWNAVPQCGSGLHGLLWGEGDGELLNWSKDAKWLVVEVEKDDITDIHGKVKFPKGNVVFCGNRLGATQYIYNRAPKNVSIVGADVKAGDDSSASAGYKGKVTIGNYSFASVGKYGSIKTGIMSRAVAGDYSIVECGDYSTVVVGNESIANGKKYTTIVAGHTSIVSADDKSTIMIKYWDEDDEMYKMLIGYVGKDLISNAKYTVKKNKFYRLKK